MINQNFDIVVLDDYIFTAGNAKLRFAGYEFQLFPEGSKTSLRLNKKRQEYFRQGNNESPSKVFEKVTSIEMETTAYLNKYDADTFGYFDMNLIETQVGRLEIVSEYLDIVIEDMFLYADIQIDFDTATSTGVQLRFKSQLPKKATSTARSYGASVDEKIKVVFKEPIITKQKTQTIEPKELSFFELCELNAKNRR